jgi:hypothetical protein
LRTRTAAKAWPDIIIIVVVTIAVAFRVTRIVVPIARVVAPSRIVKHLEIP